MYLFPELSDIEKNVYIVIAHSAVDGVCCVPACRMYRRCGLKSKHYFRTYADSLEAKGLIRQEPGWQGIPWTATLIPFRSHKQGAA